MKRFALLPLLLISFGAGCAKTLPASPTTVPTESQRTTPAEARKEPQPEVNELRAGSGQRVGDPLTVSHVKMEKPGFIVIRENTNLKPGKVLGTSSLLQQGEYSNVTLPIKMESGQSYWMTLNADNNNGTFNETEDLPVADQYDVMILTRIDAPDSTITSALSPSVTTTTTSTPPTPFPPTIK